MSAFVDAVFCLEYFLLDALFIGNTVFIQGAAATPLELVKEMTDYGKSSGLKKVMVCHMHTEGVAGYTEPDCEGKRKLHSSVMSPVT